MASPVSSWFPEGCPKCGYTGETTLQYGSTTSHEFSGPKVIEEWLERTCRRCRYVAKEPCLG